MALTLMTGISNDLTAAIDELHCMFAANISIMLEIGHCPMLSYYASCSTCLRARMEALTLAIKVPVRAHKPM